MANTSVRTRVTCACLSMMFVFSWFATAGQALASQQGETSHNSIVVNVVPEAQVIYPFLPLHVWVVLLNDGDQTEDVVISLPVGLRYAYDLKGPWYTYTHLGTVNAAPTPPNPIQLKPGELRRWPFIVDFAMDRSGENVFHILQNAPERLYLQAVIYGRLSMPIEIAIQKPQDADYLAMSSLRENPLLAWGFSERILLGIEQQKITQENIRDFIHDHGGSRYADYARMGKAIFLLNSNDGNIRRRAIEMLLEIGDSSPADIQARALWYAAQGMELESNQRVWTLKRAQNAAPDEFFSVLIAEQLAQ